MVYRYPGPGPWVHLRTSVTARPLHWASAPHRGADSDGVLLVTGPDGP